jgi:hypothetical protein
MRGGTGRIKSEHLSKDVMAAGCQQDARGALAPRSTGHARPLLERMPECGLLPVTGQEGNVEQRKAGWAQVVGGQCVAGSVERMKGNEINLTFDEGKKQRRYRVRGVGKNLAADVMKIYLLAHQFQFSSISYKTAASRETGSSAPPQRVGVRLPAPEAAPQGYDS